MDDQGGMAAILNIDTNFADFTAVSATGRKKSTIGLTLEQGPMKKPTRRYSTIQYRN
jgi:hypothetical protein